MIIYCRVFSNCMSVNNIDASDIDAYTCAICCNLATTANTMIFECHDKHKTCSTCFYQCSGSAVNLVRCPFCRHQQTIYYLPKVDGNKNIAYPPWEIREIIQFIFYILYYTSEVIHAVGHLANIYILGINNFYQ